MNERSFMDLVSLIDWRLDMEGKMGESCQAAVFNGDGTMNLREFAVPDPPEGGAILQVAAVGLCGSDVAQRDGMVMVPGCVFPVVPGHEIVGRIWKLGRGSEALGVEEGDLVAVNEALGVDGPPFTIYGYSFPADEGPGLFGGYGEYMVILPGSQLYRFDSDVSPADATLFEPLASAIHWVDTVGVRPGDVVVVQGPGHQGLTVVAAALAAGAGTVIVTGRTDGVRLDAARALGAHHVINVRKTDPVERVAELTGGRMADVVMDISPATEAVPLSLDLARFGGRILLAGFKHNTPVDGLLVDAIPGRALQIFGGLGYSPDSMARSVQLIDTGAVDVATMRGEVFGLDGLDEAFALLTRSAPGRDAVRVGLVHSH